MQIFLNYLGQLRIYSLVDLILLLVAVGPTKMEFAGVVILHIAFLAYLESRHSHQYRTKVPYVLWIILGIIGTVLYGHVEVLGFIVFSYLYTKKTYKFFGSLSFVCRGFQMFFLIAGITSYTSVLPWIALFLLSARNLLGDFRDAGKDSKEGMKTLPVLFGIRKNIKYIHLVALMFTSFISWSLGSLSFFYLLIALLIEIGTYNLTPR